MVLFTLSFTFGVWLLQQQATLPDIGWVWLLIIPLALLIITGNSRVGASLPAKVFRLPLIAAFACGLGFYHAAWQAQQRLSINLAGEWQGRDIEVIGVVAELPHISERGLRFAFDAEQTLTPQARVPRIFIRFARKTSAFMPGMHSANSAGIPAFVSTKTSI